MHCREILFTPGCSPRASEFPRSVNFSVRRTVAELRGVKLPNFRILAYFPHTKPLNVPSYDQSKAQGLHRRMITIFPCGSQRSKEVPSGTGVFLRVLVWELGTPKLAQIFAYGIHGASDLDQRCLKKRNSEDGCTFPPNIFAPTPKITPKPHFGWPFNAKPIIRRALRKSHVNGATKLKLYSYISIGKYLGCVKIFPLGGIQGAQGPLM